MSKFTHFDSKYKNEIVDFENFEEFKKDLQALAPFTMQELMYVMATYSSCDLMDCIYEECT